MPMPMAVATATAAADERPMRMNRDSGFSFRGVDAALFGASTVFASMSFSRLSKNLSGTVYGVWRVALSKLKFVLLISLVPLFLSLFVSLFVNSADF